MEDIFYFSKETVSLADINALAVEIGYRCQHVSDVTGTHLKILIDDFFTRLSQQKQQDTSQPSISLQQDFWLWSDWGADYDLSSIEPANLRRILDYQPKSSFVVSYHPLALSNLRVFLKRVLSSYGGWAGCDDNWEVVYDRNSVDLLQCK